MGRDATQMSTEQIFQTSPQCHESCELGGKIRKLSTILSDPSPTQARTSITLSQQFSGMTVNHNNMQCLKISGI